MQVMCRSRIGLGRVLVVAGLLACGVGGCAKQYTRAQFDALEARSQGALLELRVKEPELGDALDRSIAHAIFPRVGQGGASWLGLALGDGLLYEGGEVTGTARYSEFSIGPQLGGLAGTRVVVFNTREALDDFKDGADFAAGGESIAVAGAHGVSGSGQWKKGSDTFRSPNGGLMLHATLKAGTYRFRPIEDAMKEDSYCNAGSKDREGVQ